MNASFELASISFRSWPAQNARPAPAITTTRTEASAAIASSSACMRVEHRAVDRVELRGAVERQRGDAVRVLAQDERLARKPRGVRS